MERWVVVKCYYASYLHEPAIHCPRVQYYGHFWVSQKGEPNDDMGKCRCYNQGLFCGAPQVNVDVELEMEFDAPWGAQEEFWLEVFGW